MAKKLLMHSFFGLAAFTCYLPGPIAAQPMEFNVDIDRLHRFTVEWENCINVQSPVVASQSETYRNFERRLSVKCGRYEGVVQSVFYQSLPLDLSPAERERRSAAISKITKNMRSQFAIGSEKWFAEQRSSLSVPRYFPGMGGEDCTQRIAARKLGNHDAVEKAFPASAVKRDPLETTQQFQNRNNARVASALAAIDHAQGKPVVYTSLPIHLQYSSTPFYGSYDADKGVLSVSIVDTFAYDPSSRDDVGSDMLNLRSNTVKGESYGAQNGFGASTTVSSYRSVGHHWQVSNGGAGKYKLKVDLPIAPAALRPQLAQLRLFILGDLQEPYVSRRNVRYQIPTMQAPHDGIIDAVIVYAPLRCAAIFNAVTGKVLTAGAIKVAALP